MKKVPVGASIAHAYEFLFGHIFQIIGSAWVPALLLGLGYDVSLSAMQYLKPMTAPDGAAIAALVVPALAGVVFVLVIRSVLGISLTQEALGVRKDLTLAHFVIGPRELRLFFGYVRYYLVFLLLYVVVLGVSFGTVFLARNFGARLLPAMLVGGKPAAVIAATVLACLLVIWFFLSMLRLVFLLPPIASAEHRMRLSRAWTLTRGSTFRILFVFIGTFLPAMIAFGVAFYYLIGPADLSALGQAFHNLKPGQVPPLTAFLAAHAGKLSVLVAVFAAINSALLAGASATAYRTVTGHEDPELEDDAALVAPLLAPVEERHEEPAGHGDHGHGGHEDHGHGGHEDHGHDGHDDHGHGGGHEDHGHGDNGHGGHEEHGHGGHEDHGHGGHDDHDHGGGHGHGGHEEPSGHDEPDGHEEHGHGGHDDHGHGGHGHGDHGHHGQDDHGHGDHGHGDHGHSDHGHANHGHNDHGHHAKDGHHGDGRAAA